MDNQSEFMPSSLSMVPFAKYQNVESPPAYSESSNSQDQHATLQPTPTASQTENGGYRFSPQHQLGHPVDAVTDPIRLQGDVAAQGLNTRLPKGKLTAMSATSIHPADLVNASNRGAGMYWTSDTTNRPCAEGTKENSFSGNTTENVRVDSSLHVAEIVGKQGVKIKRIRANTNTWIKTPARGQEPIFIISGRKEGVEQAKKEILASAAKVARLRELRDKQFDENYTLSHLEANANSVKVSVPANAVGLVIGPNGSKIREIAMSTNTIIKTPSRYKEPVFEVLGNQKDVATARVQILDFVRERMDEDYIRKLMAQLPIHDSTSAPATGATGSKALTVHDQPAFTQQSHDFTQLRPFSPYTLSQVSPLQTDPSSHHMLYADLLTSHPSSSGALSHTLQSAAPISYQQGHITSRSAGAHNPPHSPCSRLVPYDSLTCTQYLHADNSPTPMLTSPMLTSPMLTSPMLTSPMLTSPSEPSSTSTRSLSRSLSRSLPRQYNNF